MTPAEVDRLAEWVRQTLAGGADPPEPTELGPEVVAALSPLVGSYRALKARQDDLDNYLVELSEVFLEFSAGNFDIQVRLRGEDHTDAVSLGLNMMLEELQATTEQLSVARDQALAASAAKSTFLANMSHELRTPLNAIIGYGELIQDELSTMEGQDENAEDVAKILRAAKHLLSLISDVLDLSKVEAGKMEIAREAVFLDAILTEVADTVRPTVEARGNTLELEMDDAPAMPVLVDTMKLRQTLLNLTGNAAKFTTDGAITMKLRVDPPGHQAPRGASPGRFIHIEVQDTGIGISSDRLEAIFDPFTQERADTARLHGGTGLGLAICARFAKLMGGEMTVKSTVGEGSSFTLSLPLDFAKRTDQPAPQRVNRPPGATVLVVDDDPVAHELMRRHLAPLGCSVVTATGGEDALNLARSLRPSLITLDVFMPEMDGWTTLARLKSEPGICEIPVVMVTIHDDTKRGFALGADEYITKPVDRKRLLDIVSRHAGDARRKVLVVDDNADAREVASRMLKGAGFVVSTATNGKEALDSVADDAPDVILLDLMMPVMDGFEVVSTLTADPEFAIPIVILTAKQIDDEDRAKLMSGAHSILSKGRDLPQVLARMMDALNA